MQFFFDESIHDSAGFILGAWVAFSTNPEDILSSRLRELGLSETLEFHSAMRMDEDGVMAALRDAIRSTFIPNASIAVSIVPREERRTLSLHALRSLKQTLERNQLSLGHEYYLDQGLFRPQEGAEAARQLQLDHAGEFYFEQDSSKVRGIQFADLVAHNCALMLKDSLGLLRKTVPAGEKPGYDPDLLIDLDFELWATVRHCFFGESRAATAAQLEAAKDIADFALIEVRDRGFYVADSCSARLHAAAKERLGSMYVGCIH
jgi:hypothetical protein